MSFLSEVVGICNQVRKSLLSEKVTYRTVNGMEYEILASPWVNGFQDFQMVGAENINQSQKRCSFTVIKDQLEFGGSFRVPKVGDEIIEQDGTINTVQTDANEPHWHYDDNNPEKNTIIINCFRYGK